MKTWTQLALAAVLVTVVGCGSDNKAKPDGAVLVLTDGGGSDAGNDGSVAPGADGGTDGAATTDGGLDAPLTVSLVDFVTDLVKNSTTATAQPATLEDKKITDTDDPAAFDKLLGP